VTSGLWPALLADGKRGTLHHWQDDGFARSSWDAIAADAHAAAARLRTAGVRPGSPVATVLTNSVATVTGILGIWLAGGIVASFPLPARGQTHDEYANLLGTLIARLDPAVLVLEERLHPYVPAEVSAHLPVLEWRQLTGSGRIDPCPPGDDDIAFVQYSSGSTSTPKGCALTPRAIEAQLRILCEMSGGRPGAETMASWLPLSHDMGVFGSLLYSWAYDYDMVLSTPERFALAPRSWFRDMSEYGATMTGGTSTALHLATRAQGRGVLPRPLELRVCVVGAERVDWDTVVAANEVFAASGLSPTTFMPAYGMAEATLAVSATPADARPSMTAFDSASLADGTIAQVAEDTPGAARLVSNGPPLNGVSVTESRPGAVSELLVSSPSLALGYFGDPQRTAERFADGRLRTGDLGFVHGGEVFLVGRADDVISVGGRTVYTGEIESAIESLGPVRKGSSALVDVPADGLSRLVLLLEPARKNEDFALIADRAAAIAREKAGIALSECVFVERGFMPRTPSGKIQRFRCRTLLGGDGDELKTIARVRLG
jgi:fatty-acyl-CoA synthase